MQIFKKTSSYAVLFVLLCGSVALNAQIVIRENIHGEKIKVYPDGRMEYFNGDPYVPSEGEQITYPVFEGYIAPLDGEISVNEQDLFRIAQRRAQLSTVANDLALQRVNEAESNLNRLQDQLSSVENDAQRLAVIQKQIRAAEATLRESRRLLGEAQNIAQTDADLVSRGGFVDRFNENRRQTQAREERSQRIKATSGQSYAELIPLTDNTVAGVYEDLMRRPPVFQCGEAFNGVDEETQRPRRDLAPELLFTYTDERLRPYLNDKEYLVCEAYLSSSGGYRFLTLDFTFSYPNAREAYGFLDLNSFLTIKLLNGEYVNLRAGTLDRGLYDTVKQELKYSVYYPIDRSYIGLLKSSEVDLIRVFWSSGFEEYAIRQMDFFQRQLRCLGD